MKIKFALGQYFGEARGGQLDSIKSLVTIKNSEETWRMFLKKHPVEYLDELTEPLFRSFLHYLEFERKLAPMTIKTYRKNISAFLYWCVRKRYLPENPIKYVKGPKIKHDLPKFYTEEELEKIMRAVQLDDKPYFERLRNEVMFMVLLLVGVRRGELLSLKTSDVNFETASLTVRAITSKTRTSRSIPMPSILTGKLRAYVDERSRFALATSDDLWVSLNTRQRLTEHGFKHITERLSRVVGFNVRPHSFRHSCATYAYAATQDIVAVQKMLGHTDIGTTMIYTNVLPENVRNATESSRLNALCMPA
ncbi:MAG: tyrosine-type recombinase/integrase [Patescibacteria group bacterium]|jgi:site-specific recombinase XerD